MASDLLGVGADLDRVPELIMLGVNELPVPRCRAAPRRNARMVRLRCASLPAEMRFIGPAAHHSTDSAGRSMRQAADGPLLAPGFVAGADQSEFDRTPGPRDQRVVCESPRPTTNCASSGRLGDGNAQRETVTLRVGLRGFNKNVRLLQTENAPLSLAALPRTKLIARIDQCRLFNDCWLM